MSGCATRGSTSADSVYRPRHPFAWAVLYGIALVGFAVFVLLDTFLFPHVQTAVVAIATGTAASDDATTATASTPNASTAAPTVTDTSYADENIQITISTLRVDDTDVYVADVQVSSVAYLKTALAQDTFGRNIKQATSDMAEAHDAILAINGDYYGFRDDGFVVRNGVLYRDTVSSGTDALVVGGDGTLSAIGEDAASAASLASAGYWQVLSFGPVLVDDGQLAVDENDEVDKSMTSNPRTAIGMVRPLHYVLVVSDGRTSESEGLTLYQLAQVMQDAGCTFAYNLDGGGSSTMWFNGSVVNNPTDGHSSGERTVSDIVYIG